MKQRLKYKFVLGALSLCARLPFCVLYGISDVMYLLVYHIAGYRKKVVETNLANAFPEKSAAERKDIERKFYRHLCDCFVETIKLLHISDQEADRRIQVTNGALIDQLAADGRPIVLFLGHYGNWEWVPAITRHYKRDMIGGQIFRPMHNLVMGEVMLKIRSRFNTINIPQKKAFRTLLQMKMDGQQNMIGFIADQRPNKLPLLHWTTFLNQDTAYSTGGEEIGKRTNAHYVYLDIEKAGRGHYRLTFVPVDALDDGEAHPYTRRFLQMLEATIRRAPQYWLWSHKRWRASRPQNLKTR